MNKLNEKIDKKVGDKHAGPKPAAETKMGAATFIKMEGTPDPKPQNDDDDKNKTPDNAVKEPLTPVPAQDEINPPLSATLGGDDVVLPLK